MKRLLSFGVNNSVASVFNTRLKGTSPKQNTLLGINDNDSMLIFNFYHNHRHYLAFMPYS